jgi:hypothetical protein
MKIAIITFHFVNNYGATLQAYALSALLKSYGHNVFFINYKSNKKIKFIDNIKALFVQLLNLRNFRERTNKTKKFKKQHFKLVSIKDALLFDALVCGSDQIWNLDLFKNMKPYFLDFNLDSGIIRMSYAASIGKHTLNMAEKKKFRYYLNNIDYISVREDSIVGILKEVCDKDITHVIDPVFLLDSKHWLSLLGERIIKGNYIVLYTMESNLTLIEYSKKLAKEKGLPVIHISGGIRKYTGIQKIITNAGPLEFLNLLYHSSYVCTNSFHGVAFSMIFYKPFFVLPHSSRNSRIESLLSKANLKDHIINSSEDYQKLYKKDFQPDKTSYSLIAEHIKESVSFLKKVF